MSTVEIRIAGKGGQGIVLAGEILAYAAVLDGKEASVVSAYGSEARGGVVDSEVVIGDTEIPAPFVIEADYILLLSKESYATYAGVGAGTSCVIYDSTAVGESERGGKRYPVPASQIASVTVGSPVAANMVLLGAFAGLTGIVSQESIRAALKEKTKGEALETNIRAVEEGYKNGRELAR